MEARFLLFPMITCLTPYSRILFIGRTRQTSSNRKGLFRLRAYQRNERLSLGKRIRRRNIRSIVLVVSWYCLIRSRFLYRNRRFFPTIPKAGRAETFPDINEKIRKYFPCSRPRAVFPYGVLRVNDVTFMNSVNRFRVRDHGFSFEAMCTYSFNRRLRGNREVLSTKRSSRSAIAFLRRPMINRSFTRLSPSTAFRRLFNNQLRELGRCGVSNRGRAWRNNRVVPVRNLSLRRCNNRCHGRGG